MKNIKQIENNSDFDNETIELIKFSRQMLRLARQMREKKLEQPTKGMTHYEKAIRINPYISKNNIVKIYLTI